MQIPSRVCLEPWSTGSARIPTALSYSLEATTTNAWLNSPLCLNFSLEFSHQRNYCLVCNINRIAGNLDGQLSFFLRSVFFISLALFLVPRNVLEKSLLKNLLILMKYLLKILHFYYFSTDADFSLIYHKSLKLAW